MDTGPYRAAFVNSATIAGLRFTQLAYPPRLRLPRHHHAGPYLCLVAAGRFEDPPTASSDMLGAAAVGPNYKVLDPVTGDGLLRIYRVKSKYGTFTVQGDAMLIQRRKELAAVDALEKQSETKAFAEAFGQAAIGPLKFAANLVTDPANTVDRTVSGIGEMFDRVSRERGFAPPSRPVIAADAPRALLGEGFGGNAMVLRFPHEGKCKRRSASGGCDGHFGLG